MEPAELRTEIVPFTLSKLTDPALVLALTVPSQSWMLTVPAEDSATIVPFTPVTVTQPTRFSRLRSVSAGTETRILALGPPENIYLGQPKKGETLVRHVTVTTLPSCKMFQSKSSGILRSKSTVTSASGPDLTSTDPGAMLVTTTLGLPVTFKVRRVSIGFISGATTGVPQAGQNLEFLGNLAPHRLQ